MKDISYKKRCNICSSINLKILINSLDDHITKSEFNNGMFWKCQDCGFVFQNNPPQGNNLLKAYKDYYTQKIFTKNDFFMGDQRFNFLKSFYCGFYLNKKDLSFYIINLLIKFLPFFKFFVFRAVRFLPTYSTNLNSKKLLDIGCGNGKFLLRAKDIGFEVLGIDFDPISIKNLEKNDLKVICGDLLELNLNSKFDAITISHVIEHVINPSEYIEEIFKLLKPGGYLYISTPNIESLGFRIFGKYWRGIDYPRHISFFTHQTLKKELRKKGFSKIKYIYDLNQSFNIALSSLKIFKKYSKSNAFLKLLEFIFKNPFKINNHEVVVIKAYK